MKNSIVVLLCIRCNIFVFVFFIILAEKDNPPRLYILTCVYLIIIAKKYTGVLYPNFLLAGYFFMFCCHLLTFFRINFLENYFKNTIRVSNSLDPDQDRRSVCPDLGQNCLQMQR